MNDGPARALTEKCKEIIKRKEWQRKGKATWCNQAFFTIAEELNYDIILLCNFVKSLGRKHRGYTNANSIYINAKKAEKEGIIDSINNYKAVQLANDGIIVLVASHSIDGFSRYGHVAIVCPDFHRKDFKDIKIIQAGWSNGVFLMSKMFPGEKVTTPILYDLTNLKLERMASA